MVSFCAEPKIFRYCVYDSPLGLYVLLARKRKTTPQKFWSLDQNKKEHDLITSDAESTSSYVDPTYVVPRNTTSTSNFVSGNT